jgi:predicted nucleic acid-binding Zn ribbon protein
MRVLEFTDAGCDGEPRVRADGTMPDLMGALGIEGAGSRMRAACFCSAESTIRRLARSFLLRSDTTKAGDSDLTRMLCQSIGRSTLSDRAARTRRPSGESAFWATSSAWRFSVNVGLRGARLASSGSDETANSLVLMTVFDALIATAIVMVVMNSLGWSVLGCAMRDLWAGQGTKAVSRPSNNQVCMHRTTAQAQSAQRRTVRATMLFVVFVCLSLLAVDVWLAWKAREQQLRQAVISNTNLAAAVAQQMDGMMSEVGQLLDSIVFELELGRLNQQVLERLTKLRQ